MYRVLGFNYDSVVYKSKQCDEFQIICCRQNIIDKIQKINGIIFDGLHSGYVPKESIISGVSKKDIDIVCKALYESLCDRFKYHGICDTVDEVYAIIDIYIEEELKLIK